MKRNEQGKAIPMAILDKIHRAPVHLIKFNREYNTVVSVDTKGMVEYWDAETYNLPENIEFKRKSDTDLYEFPKVRAR
jgi:peptidylprolyl isomerase domain and WD repeat-containing protein 1